VRIYDDLPEWLLYDVDEVEALQFPETLPEFPQTTSEPETIAHVLSIARKHLENDVQADALRARAKELVAKAQRRDKDNERLKDHIVFLMGQAAIKKVKDEEFTISVATRAGTIEVEDLDKLPIAFVRIKREANKLDLNAHFKSTGEIPEGCNIGEDKKYVTIRSK